MWGGSITRQQLLQSISLFQTLDDVPELPKENILESDIDSTCSLSTLRKQEITSNLAFLSAISDDSRRVMALCVEEHHSQRNSLFG